MVPQVKYRIGSMVNGREVFLAIRYTQYHAEQCQHEFSNRWPHVYIIREK